MAQQGGVNLRDFEAAVCIVVDGSSQSAEVFRNATAYIQSVSSMQNSYQLCVQLLMGSTQPAARFFALQALCQFVSAPAYLAMDGHARSELRRVLLEYARARALSGELASEATYVRTKLALVFALLIKSEYPEAWPGAFSELLSIVHVCGGLAQSGGGAAAPAGPSLPALCACDLVLRVLSALHSEVVDHRIHRSPVEAARNTAIKDAMRLRGETAVLAEFWYACLTACAPAVSTTEASLAARGAGGPPLVSLPHVAVPRLVLLVMAAFVDWTDIKLYAHEAGARLHVSLLGSALLRTGVTRLLLALVEKGADPASRLALLQALQLVEVTRLLTVAVEGALAVPGAEDDPGPYGDTGTEDDGDFGEAVATLVSAVTGVVLEAGDNAALMASSAAQCAWTADALRTCVGLALRLLDASGTDVGLGLAVLPTVSTLVAFLQREMRPGGGAASPGRVGGRPAGVSCGEFMPALLSVVVRQFAYPADFEPVGSGAVAVGPASGSDDGEEGDFRSFREALRKVFLNLVRCAPDAVLAVLTGSSAPSPPDPRFSPPWAPAALAALPSAPWPVAERALTLLFLYGEGAGAMGDGSGRTHAGPLHEALLAALGCGLVTAGPGAHPAVVLAYFELAARFTPLLLPPRKGEGSSDSTGLLPGILQALVGPAGLRCPIPAVRSRTSFLLLKLIKAVGRTGQGGPAEALGVYADPILRGIAEFLVVHPPPPAPPPPRAGAAVASLEVEADCTRGPSGLGHDAAEYLFEAAGILLGTGGALAPIAALAPPAGSLSVEARIGYTEAIFVPVLAGLDGVLAQTKAAIEGGQRGGPGLGAEGEASIVAYLVRCLSAIGHVTKGFGPSLASTDRLARLQEHALSSAMGGLTLLPLGRGLRSKTLFLLHRLVDCLDTRLLLSLPACMPPLLGLRAPAEAGGAVVPSSLPAAVAIAAEDVVGVFTLLTQALARFGAREVAGGGPTPLLDLLSAWLPALAQRVHAALPPPTEGGETGVELAKAWVLFLSAIAGGGPGIATAVLGRGAAGGGLAALLGTLTDLACGRGMGGTGAVAPDPPLAKGCLGAIGSLVKAWLPVQVTAPAKAAGARGGLTQPASPHPVRVEPLPSPLDGAARAAFLAWVVGPALGATWGVSLAPGFDPSDAQAASMVAEALALQALIAVHVAAVTGAPPPSASASAGEGAEGSRGGVDAISVMATSMLPSMGVSQATAKAYAERLRASLGQPKDARQVYLAVVAEAKRAQRGSG